MFRASVRAFVGLSLRRTLAVCCGGRYLPSLAAGMSRNPRQVDSRFILILVDVVTAPVVTDAADEGDLVLVELEATACDDD